MIAVELPAYECARTAETIVVDGRLSEETWQFVPGVKLVRSENGANSGPDTYVKACWNDTHLFLAFQCQDDDAWGTYRQRDDPLYDEEVVEVFLSPTGVLSRYFEIEVSPHNVVFDAAIHSPDLDRRTMATDLRWTCQGLVTAVQSTAPVHDMPPHLRAERGPSGTWTVEMAIPFSSLGVPPPQAGTEWRVNFYRIDVADTPAFLAWSPTLRSPADFHVPKRFGTLRFVADEVRSVPDGQWSPEKAWRWYRRIPWLVGCNFIPSTASNQLEMWQAETFDEATIDRELGWAAELGMNVVRVYLHDLAWHVDPRGFKNRLRRFLAIARVHGIRPILVLFDDCWNPNPVPGPQPPPEPGVHNSRWLQSPGVGIVNDATQWPRLEAYVKDVIGSFRNDRRILMWDLFNEPGNSGQGVRSLPLLRAAFHWARQVRPAQPLTAGVWADLPELNRFQIEHSDVITFHNYEDAGSLERQIVQLRAHGRPLLCTEWMARPRSTIQTHLPVFRQYKVGCIVWGLVAGKTQTIYPWGSKGGGPEPNPWFHDLLRADGTPYDADETRILREQTSLGRAKP